MPFLVFAQTKPKTDTIKLTNQKKEIFKLIKNQKIKIYL
jgi:hypothetical protein